MTDNHSEDFGIPRILRIEGGGPCRECGSPNTVASDAVANRIPNKETLYKIPSRLYFSDIATWRLHAETRPARNLRPSHCCRSTRSDSRNNKWEVHFFRSFE